MDTSGNTSNQNTKSIVIFMENQQTPIIIMAARDSIANSVHKRHIYPCNYFYTGKHTIASDYP